jgi:peptidoglycan/xylan/chitin deacetylase (PgdA/CDA1 family)
MTPICHPIVWKLTKNEQVLRSLLLGQAPEFVRRRNAPPPEGEIPVFTFHAVHADILEAQCRHLVENGYRTLPLEEFEACLDGSGPVPRRQVLLTFDDGLREVWTIAFPLLRKYGLQAVCFLIPGLIPERSRPPRPNLEQVWKGEIALADLQAGHPGESPMCSWEEIRAMHESGVVTFQSHSLYHALVFNSPRIFDFVNPGYDPYFYGNIHVPIYRRDGTDVVSREPLPGLPIYYARPRLGAERRFLDDERIRDLCLAEVEREGGTPFFGSRGWRRRLSRLVERERRRGASRERFETPEERDREVLAELNESRRVIEERLPGRKVTHFCYPWYEAAPFAPALVRQAGYRYQHFGQLTDRLANRPGEGSEFVTRVDELFLFRLPGAGRRKIHKKKNQA